MINIKCGPGNALALRSISSAKRDLDRGIHSALHNIGRENVKAARKSLLEPKTGRLYRYYINGRRVNHRASAPGESPAYLTGELSRGYGYEVTGSRFLEWGNTVEYSLRLEQGSPGGQLAPRPNILKVVDKNEGLTIKYLKNANINR